jgi:hypothetical protein
MLLLDLYEGSALGLIVYGKFKSQFTFRAFSLAAAARIDLDTEAMAVFQFIVKLILSLERTADFNKVSFHLG